MSRSSCIVAQSVKFKKQIYPKSALSHIQDMVIVSPLQCLEEEDDGGGVVSHGPGRVLVKP